MMLGRLFSLMIREHYFIEKKFNNKRKENFFRWQTCYETVIQALQDIYDDDIINNYEERLQKTKSAVEMIEGFPDKKLPYKQEMLTYIYTCAGLTYIKIGDFTQAKGFDQKDWEIAVEKLLGKQPVDEHPWEVALLHFTIIRCHLQAEDMAVSLELSSRSLDAARKSEDRKLLLYGTVLLAYAEAKRHSNLSALKYVTQSLEISESLNYEVATTFLNDVYWELHTKVDRLPTIATGESPCRRKALRIVPESNPFNQREYNIFRRVSSSSDEHDYPDQVTEDITESMVAQRFDLRFQRTWQSTEDSTASPVNQAEPQWLTDQSLFVHLEQATHRKEVYTDHRANGDDTEPKDFSGAMNLIEETKPKELSGCYTPGRLGPEGQSNRSSLNPIAPRYLRTSADSDTSEEETVPKEI